ncbi:hypothetical protein [Phyllobacterium sp. P30BS-XVII]|uniref:hypothetical protein n=1 Tax=Phyllobacterium sp. P30BS-XVII TaxID=2587046 RepID=UPI0015FAA271|nr:hypothetical protein [Phyllobacterium sp. P30BS-XVII]MBA8903258.1 ABC-type antimicrobial peptide transport system permease subunit [Phyllobacterium sp. P30BS-XVII]
MPWAACSSWCGGIAVALGFGWLFCQFSTPFELIYSPASIIAALVCSRVIGIFFGVVPARKASSLDPVACLVRD